MQTRSKREDGGATALWSGRWWLPIWCLGLGTVLFTAEAIGGNLGDGLIVGGTMVVAAGAFFVGERSDAFRGIGGSDGDERYEGIDVTAMAFAGRTMAIAVIAAWAYELSQGHDGAEYSWVLGVGTVAYLGSMAWLRRRC